MNTKNRTFFLILAAAVLVLATLACQVPEDIVPTSPPGAGSNPTLPPQTTRTPPPTPTEPSLRDTFLFPSDPNTACFIHSGLALSCLDSSGWHIYTTEDYEYPLAVPGYIEACPGGRIYIQMYGSLFLLQGEQMAEIGTDEFSSTYDIACGPGEDELWVAHYEGISHYDGSAWTHYLSEGNLGSGEYVTLVYGIVVDPSGRAWAATADSVTFFDGASWQVFEEGQGFSEDPNPEEIAVDSLGSIWVAGSDLWRYDGTRWTSINLPKGSPQTLAVDSQDRVWVGTTQGIYVYDPAAGWVLSFGLGPLSEDYVTDLAFDGQGRLWVVTNYGMNIYDGSTWTAYHVHTADLASNEAEQVAVLGLGPALPALMEKPTGSVSGSLVNPDGSVYTGWQVELCITRHIISFFGATPCANDPFHRLTTLDSQGGFSFPDVPQGEYTITIQLDSDTWRNWEYFDVLPGQETLLGVITVEPEE